MRLITPFLFLLSSTTTLAWSWKPFFPTHHSSDTCSTASLAAFIPSNVPKPSAAFHHYLQQAVCQAPPKLTGLVARNRFEEDYERFAKYFNKNRSRVPKACRKRFKKVAKKGKIPKRYNDYVRKEEKKCGKKLGKTQPGGGQHLGGSKNGNKMDNTQPGGGHYHGGSGSGSGSRNIIYYSAAVGFYGGAMSFIARGVVVGATIAYAWCRAML